MMPSRHATRIWPAYAALVLTTALWGSNPAISRLVMDAVPPVALAWGRWLVVVLALSPFMWSERREIGAALRERWRALLTREQIEEQLCAWGRELESNSIEVYVHRLRKRLRPELLRTIRGVGYAIGGSAP